LQRVVNVVGGDIPAGAAARAAGLFENLSQRVVVELVSKEPVAVLRAALVGADILHCTCHGRLDPYLLQVAQDRQRSLNLSPDAIQLLPLEPGSFVFANACASALPVLLFGRYTSFGWEFYRRGAGAFVGTLGAVPATLAVGFAESVYEEFCRGQTIGVALAAARRSAAEQRNLFWLFYCIYGNPDLSLNLAAS
jgi:hypothetical protein